MSAAFPPSLMMMQRPLGSSTAFSIDSLIGSPPQPSPGHFVYTGYPMFMPYRPVVLPPPPPPPPALQPALPPAHPHHQIPSLPTSFCSGLAQGMALTSTLMATLPGGFSASPQHQEAAAARKFAPQPLPGGGNFDKAEALQADAEDGKGFLAKEGSLLSFSAAEAVQASLGESAARAAGTRGGPAPGSRGTLGTILLACPSPAKGVLSTRAREVPGGHLTPRNKQGQEGDFSAPSPNQLLMWSVWPNPPALAGTGFPGRLQPQGCPVGLCV